MFNFSNFFVYQALDGADGFQNTHQRQQFQSAEFSIDQVVFILESQRTYFFWMIWQQRKTLEVAIAADQV
ncbi:hypothetical protein CerSpe_142880 [Prunus speciosa]